MIITDINGLSVTELEVLALRCGTSYEINDGRIVGIVNPAKRGSEKNA